ncbi:MAG: RsmD family RNA methyltransferase [Bacteriovoracaceae bacterium]
MSVKILGGIARGFPLSIPKTEATRPTSVLIKRKLFDWRQNLEGFVFIDLFAGSGAMGFEALSRGADQVILNDNGKSSFITLKENKEKLVKAFSFSQEAIIVTNLESRAWIQKELSYRLSDTSHSILFFDPPYENHNLYFDGLNLLKEQGFEGEVWVEADRLKGPKSELLTQLFPTIIKTVEQGDHFVLVGKLV